jgi:hypothetical protein
MFDQLESKLALHFAQDDIERFGLFTPEFQTNRPFYEFAPSAYSGGACGWPRPVQVFDAGDRNGRPVNNPGCGNPYGVSGRIDKSPVSGREDPL